MKEILVIASSVNGKTTKGDNPDVRSWVSKEDQENFRSILKENNLFVMGSKTYEAVKKNLKVQEGKLKIVLTSNPEKYKDQEVPGMLVFTNETPRELVERLEEGYDKLILLSGASVNASFFKSKLIDEVHLTFEPKIFGSGKPIMEENEMNASLELLDDKKLNKKGTFLFKYKVKY